MSYEDLVKLHAITHTYRLAYFTAMARIEAETEQQKLRRPAPVMPTPVPKHA